MACLLALSIVMGFSAPTTIKINCSYFSIQMEHTYFSSPDTCVTGLLCRVCQCAAWVRVAGSVTPQQPLLTGTCLWQFL